MFHNLMKHSILANHSPRKNYEESQILLAIVMTTPIATVCDGEIAASVDPKLLCAVLRAMNVAEDIAALLQQCAQFQRVCSIATFRAMAATSYILLSGYPIFNPNTTICFPFLSFPLFCSGYRRHFLPLLAEIRNCLSRYQCCARCCSVWPRLVKALLRAK